MAKQPDVLQRIGVVVIHGVGETEPGWINEQLIPNLQTCDPSLTFIEHSEVHQLPDRGRSRPNARFKAYLRRSRFRPEQPVTIMELFWADLSRVGQGPIANFFTMLQLFYEAPLVLGAAFLRQKQTGLRALLHSLIRFANWLLRWPITGLNTGVFVCAALMMGVQQLRGYVPLAKYLDFNDAYIICPILAAVALLALWFARNNVHKGILLTDIALSTAIFSSLLLIATVIANLLMDPQKLQGPAPYLNWASVPILSLWWLWNHVVAAGVFILFFMAIWKLVSPGGRQLGTLMRPAAALGLSTIQGVLWKIVIALLWFLLISALEAGSVNATLCQGQSSDDCLYLYKLNADLLGIFLMNLLMALLLGLGVLGMIGLRSLIVKYRRKAVEAQRAWMPRLIVSPVLVVLMFALTLFNFYAFFVPKYAERMEKFGIKIHIPFDVYNYIRAEFLDSGVIAYFVGTTSAVLFYGIFLRAAQNASRGVLHIMRDLVDHQYTPEFALSGFMLPKGKRIRGRYPRRERIQKRFDALMDTIVAQENCQRLILVAHSQGSVILYDYLRSNRDDKTMANTERIDVVTLGSPLGHFYQHYFPSYESSVASAERLNPKLGSWTNIWRIDDPIGNRVDVVNGDFIVNEMLPPGGHVDYWREPHVCNVILDLIDPGRVRPVSASAPRAAVQKVKGKP